MRAIFQKRTIKGKNVEKEQKRANIWKFGQRYIQFKKKWKKGAGDCVRLAIYHTQKGPSIQFNLL